ncbi:unannotated protein [freshwater metagenome]|uniref:Unannotated protein n=1 Tax=freshwater metagenome TaxID=449393 RepID=A0A6J6A205_9ZZZZ
MHRGQGPVAATNRSTDGIDNHDFTHVGILGRERDNSPGHTANGVF